jgi:hypothetical protein
MNSLFVSVCTLGLAASPLFFMNGQVNAPGDSGVLAVTSKPVGATVIIDGRYAGTTTLRDQKLTVGHHSFVLKLTGFLNVSDSFEVRRADTLTEEYEMHPACSLSISSTPAGGSVYVDNVFRGMSPIVLNDLKSGPAVIAMTKKFYFPSVDTVELSPGRLAEISPTLRPRPATLSIDASEVDVNVFVNDNFASRGTLHDTLIVPGDVAIAAKQISSGKIASVTALLLPNTTARFKVKFDLLSNDPLLRSLIFPGQGQMKAGNPALGWGMGIAFSGAVALAVGAELTGHSSFQDYITAHSSYEKATTKSEALSLHNSAQQQYDNARSAFRVRNIGLWSALAVYVLSAAEAFFIDNREDVIIQLSGATQVGMSQRSPGGEIAPTIQVGVKL